LEQLVPLRNLLILLFNHRTETALLVLINRVHALLFLKILEERSQDRKGLKEIVVLVTGHFFITLAHSDLLRDAATEWLEQSNVSLLGVLIFYGFFV